MTPGNIQKALRIKRAVAEYFIISNNKKVMAKELMDLFIEKGIFSKNHRDGLPIRDFLRHLVEQNHLHLIPQALFEQKAQNKNWYFIEIK